MIANIVKNLQIKHTAILLMLEYKKESRQLIRSSALHYSLAKREGLATAQTKVCSA